MITKQFKSQSKSNVPLRLLEALFLASVAFVAFGWASHANAQAVSYTDDTNVTINGSDYVIKAGSAATTVTVNATTLVVLVPAASTFTLASNAGFTLTNTDDAAPAVVTAQTCASGVSTVAYTGTGATVTFTPTTVRACGSSSGGGNPTSNTGSTPAATPATPATPAALTPATPATTVGAQVSGLVAQVKALVAILESRGVTISTEIKSLLNTLGVPAGGLPSPSGTFTKNLDVGAKGAEVSAIQNFLIKKGYTIPAGVTGLYGGQTRAAVAAYQKANGISPASGFFGPKTRAYVQAHP